MMTFAARVSEWMHPGGCVQTKEGLQTGPRPASDARLPGLAAAPLELTLL